MDAFHSDDTSTNNSKSEDQDLHGLFNGLTRQELLEERHGREVIDASRIEDSIEKYPTLKQLIHDANSVAVYGDEEIEAAYFNHLFRRALDIDLHDSESHGYDDLVNHISAVNSRIDERAMEEAKLPYQLNFLGGDVYETR